MIADDDIVSAAALVDEETRRNRPIKNYLDQFPVLKWSSFETELMKTKFEQMEREVKIF